MKAIDLIFRETLASGVFGMKSHVLAFIDEAGNGYSDTFSEVRHNGRFEACQYNGMEYGHMQNLLEAIFLNKVNKRADVFAKALYLRQQFKKDKVMKGQKFIVEEVKKALAGEREKEQIPSY